MGKVYKSRNINPFEVLGLSPQIVKDLSEENLYKLVKSIYKTLQMIYHPDRGGNSEKALELNLAFEVLNLEKNPESFRRHRKAYIERLSRKSLKNELKEWQSRYRKLSFYNELLKERFWQFLERGFEDLKKSLENEKKTLRLKIFDLVSHINFSDLLRIKKQMFFKEIILSSEILLKRTGWENFYHPVNDYRILGTVKREHLEPWTLLVRDLKEERVFLKDYLKKETFVREVLFYLVPELKTNSYLFIYYPFEAQKVYLEGVILKVEEISYFEFSEFLKNSSLLTNIQD
ncbi:MAG: hypothetical protein N3A56_02735 [Thermodesulfobacteriaceae bacterium]|nr:hypothetical protein [Thermodesulfobacteriaceae bacterium]